MIAKSDNPYNASSSSNPTQHDEPPPAFEDAHEDSEHVPLLPPGGQLERAAGEPEPPVFTEYHPERFQSWGDNTVSHDDHLNSDGEALYRFLLRQAEIPPRLLLHCKGTHPETRMKTVHYHENGHSRSRLESETITVTDFDFKIDITPNLVPGYELWTMDDGEPTYRGKMIKEVGVSGGKRKPDSITLSDAEQWAKQRKTQGCEPWSRYAGEVSDRGSIRSSWTLRQWADDYCASKRVLKEFVFMKSIYGWDLGSLERAVRESIIANYYQGDLKVQFKIEADKVYVRPSTPFSRALSSKFIYVVSWLLLIYPFIWLFKQFHPLGGGVWRVGGAAYNLKQKPTPVEEPDARPSKQLVALDAPLPDYQVASSSRRAPSPAPLSESGPRSGMKEGEWFRVWNNTIQGAITAKFNSSTPIVIPKTHYRLQTPLDGY